MSSGSTGKWHLTENRVRAAIVKKWPPDRSNHCNFHTSDTLAGPSQCLVTNIWRAAILWSFYGQQLCGESEKKGGFSGRSIELQPLPSAKCPPLLLLLSVSALTLVNLGRLFHRLLTSGSWLLSKSCCLSSPSVLTELVKCKKV